MVARPSWTGFLKFNLIAFPVKAYNAAAPGQSKSTFHLLHKTCQSRIRYKKVCPLHGEVSNDEIVSGLEIAKGQYVIVEDEEKRELKSEDDKAIAVDTFVPTEAIDPVYFSGRSFYLLPDGKVALKPYAVLLEAMRDQSRYAIAQVVFSGRTRVAVIRPADKIMAMTLLSFAHEVKDPADFARELDEPKVSAEERELAHTLVGAATAREFQLDKYKDEYAGKLARLVEGKTKRQRKSDSEAPAVINLMDALQRSLRKTQHTMNGKARKRKARAAKKTG
jgi:DNA end-binding protein Ku